MASPTSLLTPTSQPKSLSPIKPKSPITINVPSTITCSNSINPHKTHRREFLPLVVATISTLSTGGVFPITPSAFAENEEYVRETEEVINKIRDTINMDKSDPNVATAVAGLREASNSWVAKYRKEKALLSRVSFRDIYSALNAVSGHYISFGPTAPIPAKRKARILEEMDTAEKALLRGR